MKFTTELREVLQNFSTINNGIVFKEGDVVATMSPMKTIIAKAKVNVSFDSVFAVYNLGELLSLISSFEDPDITLLDKKMLVSQGSEKSHYSFAEPTLIVQPPEKDIKFPSVDVEFELKNDTLKRALKMASVVGAPELAIVGDGDQIKIRAFNSKNASGNDFETTVGTTDKTFNMVFLVDNIKVLPRDYVVKICAKGLSHFVAKDVEYYITVESNSTFGG